MNDGVTEGLVATATSLMQHTHQDRCSVKLAGWKSHACLSMHMVMPWHYQTQVACRNVGRRPRCEP